MMLLFLRTDCHSMRIYARPKALWMHEVPLDGYHNTPLLPPMLKLCVYCPLTPHTSPAS